MNVLTGWLTWITVQSIWKSLLKWATLSLNNSLNQELNPWFKPLPILNQQQPTSLEIYSRFELLRISTTPWTWTISDLNHSQHRFNNNTTTLELSSQMSHSEFEQLPELRLQLPVNLNRSLIEQHPTQSRTLFKFELLWDWKTISQLNLFTDLNHFHT